jgi:hypothetical protein
MKHPAPRPVRRRARVTAAALAVAAVSIFGFAGAAQAAPADCPLGYTCVYSAYNYTNNIFENGGTLKIGYCVDEMIEHSYNNMASSVFNNGRTDNVYLYDGTFKTGTYKIIARGAGKTDLGSISFNDKTSSVYFYSQLGKVNTPTCY